VGVNSFAKNLAGDRDMSILPANRE